MDSARSSIPLPGWDLPRPSLPPRDQGREIFRHLTSEERDALLDELLEAQWLAHESGDPDPTTRVVQRWLVEQYFLHHPDRVAMEHAAERARSEPPLSDADIERILSG